MTPMVTFGDDTDGNGETVSHTYEDPGEYTVRLHLTSDLGGEDIATKVIEVLDTTIDDDDGDGYTDAEEIEAGTDPNDEENHPDEDPLDSDEDGESDAEDDDDDNDGFTDLEEIIAGSDPWDELSIPSTDEDDLDDDEDDGEEEEEEEEEEDDDEEGEDEGLLGGIGKMSTETCSILIVLLIIIVSVIIFFIVRSRKKDEEEEEEELEEGWDDDEDDDEEPEMESKNGEDDVKVRPGPMLDTPGPGVGEEEVPDGNDMDLDEEAMVGDGGHVDWEDEGAEEDRPVRREEEKAKKKKPKGAKKEAPKGAAKGTKKGVRKRRGRRPGPGHEAAMGFDVSDTEGEIPKERKGGREISRKRRAKETGKGPKKGKGSSGKSVKPCPKCGNKIYYTRPFRGVVQLRCNECGSKGSFRVDGDKKE